MRTGDENYTMNLACCAAQPQFVYHLLGGNWYGQTICYESIVIQADYIEQMHELRSGRYGDDLRRSWSIFRMLAPTKRHKVQQVYRKHDFLRKDCSEDHQALNCYYMRCYGWPATIKQIFFY